MGRLNQDKPSQTDVIINSKPNHLYWHEFEAGRFFQVVHHKKPITDK